MLITIEDFLARKDIVGGDIDMLENGVLYRGPVSKVHQTEVSIRFDLLWCARKNAEGEWENWHVTGCGIPKDVKIEMLESGIIRIEFFGISRTLFLMGEEKLDPKLVKNIPPEFLE